MNVEGAQVETRLGRTVLPRFHAAWSLGSITGAGLGVLATLFGVPLGIHLVVVAILALAAELAATTAFLPAVRTGGRSSQKRGRSAWVEPRTLAIGAMVLAFTFAEGSANDWLALSLVDGYDARHFVGVAGFALFVSVMTIARVLGPQLLDRVGRVPVLLASAGATAAGVLLLILSQQPAAAALGIVLWGLGAALGFPVGVSAAADDPARAALRVSVVSSIGMGAYLAGPPLLGFVGNQVGTLNSLYVVVVLMLPAALLAHHAARPRERSSHSMTASRRAAHRCGARRPVRKRRRRRPARSTSHARHSPGAAGRPPCPPPGRPHPSQRGTGPVAGAGQRW